jgi:pimeloyl-ACP methyl ester carboxylesterase
VSVERGAFLHAGGVRTHVLKSGEGGPPALLLHGLGSLGQEILAPLREASPERLLVSPDRPGYGLSDPLAINPGPIGQAHWLRYVIDAIGGGPPVIVAHSLAAGTALAFAALYPAKVRGLVLIAPFCRPTPHALMLGLRLANLPVVGPVLRHALIPHLAPAIGVRRLRRAFAPAPVPKSLQDFPFAHAARPGSPQTMAGELLAFNRDMSLCRRTHSEIETPVHVLCAPDDSVADLQWHISWLTAWASACVVHFLRGGHMIHHSQPHATLLAVRALEAQIGAARAA